jgi:hypothetical protein
MPKSKEGGSPREVSKLYIGNINFISEIIVIPLFKYIRKMSFLLDLFYIICLVIHNIIIPMLGNIVGTILILIGIGTIVDESVSIVKNNQMLYLGLLDIMLGILIIIY